MNIDNRGYYDGWLRPGSDLCYNLHGNSVVVLGFDTPHEALYNAYCDFVTTHRLLGGRREMINELKDTIMGEAYYYAALYWNSDGTTQMVPSYKCFVVEFQTTVRKYMNKGFVFREDEYDVSIIKQAIKEAKRIMGES